MNEKEKQFSTLQLLKAIGYFLLLFSVPMIVPMLPSPKFGNLSLGNLLSPVILLLLTAWFYRKEGKNLSELGLNIQLTNLLFLPLGLILGILFFSLLLFLQSFQNDLHIQINQNANWGLIFSGAFFLIIGVLNEELIFRGYFFQKTIDYKGFMQANLIFAAIFIVYHWIALNAWGNYGLMLGLFTTGFGHILFAVALLKSKTLYFPIGIHWGNNWAQRHLFSANIGGINENPSNDTFFILTSFNIDTSLVHILGSYAITITCFLLSISVIWKFKR